MYFYLYIGGKPVALFFQWGAGWSWSERRWDCPLLAKTCQFPLLPDSVMDKAASILYSPVRRLSICRQISIGNLEYKKDGLDIVWLTTPLRFDLHRRVTCLGCWPPWASASPGPCWSSASSTASAWCTARGGTASNTRGGRPGSQRFTTHFCFLLFHLLLRKSCVRVQD